MRSALLWLIGIPIPLILLLAFCTGHLWSRAAGRGGAIAPPPLQL